MRTFATTVAALALLTLVACASPYRELEAHLAITDSHIDRNTEALEALNAKFSLAQPAPAASHPKQPTGVVCRDTPDAKEPHGLVFVFADDGPRSGERDLGMRAHCAAPRDFAWCIGSVPESDALAACAAGKIDVLFPPKKDEKKS